MKGSANSCCPLPIHMRTKLTVLSTRGYHNKAGHLTCNALMPPTAYRQHVVSHHAEICVCMQGRNCLCKESTLLGFCAVVCEDLIDMRKICLNSYCLWSHGNGTLCTACQICMSTPHGTFASITPFAMTYTQDRHKLLNDLCYLCTAFSFMCTASWLCYRTLCGTFVSITAVVD